MKILKIQKPKFGNIRRKKTCQHHYMGGGGCHFYYECIAYFNVSTECCVHIISCCSYCEVGSYLSYLFYSFLYPIVTNIKTSLFYLNLPRALFKFSWGALLYLVFQKDTWFAKYFWAFFFFLILNLIFTRLEEIPRTTTMPFLFRSLQ